MSESHANRRRRTSALVRGIATIVLADEQVTANQLIGLARLTWITKSYDGPHASYIWSTKMPGLMAALQLSGTAADIDAIAQAVASRSKDSGLALLVKQHTGFTNFYNAYRNSALAWMEQNRETVLRLCRSAYEFKSDNERRDAVRVIDNLPPIPHPSGLERPSAAANLLTPLLFALDPNCRFPIINRNGGVIRLLRNLKVLDKSLVAQFDAIVRLYGHDGIEDAADVDEIGADLPAFVATNETPAMVAILKPIDLSRDLPAKDEADVVAINRSSTAVRKREHNVLTNKLIAAFPGMHLWEGRATTCMFDALIPRYTDGCDLLIEAKSSCEAGDIRMAIGQLLHYQFELSSHIKREIHLAILLPAAPPPSVVAFLQSLDVGTLWFKDDTLCCADEWLEDLVIYSQTAKAD